jgi:putative hydrolase of the HAD superfamily
VYLEPPAPRLAALLAERFGVEVTEAVAERAIAAEISYYRANLGAGRDAASVARLRGRCAEVLRDALATGQLAGGLDGADLTETLLDSLRFRPYPEVPAALRALRGLGLRLVVASNWDSSLARTLASLGLLDQLDGVVTSAQCGAPKPEPAVFEAALALAGVGAGEALHVGDRLDEDVLGARAAGIEPVLLARERAAGAPGVRTIASLTELVAALSSAA